MRVKLSLIIIAGMTIFCFAIPSLAKEIPTDIPKELVSAYTKFSFNLFGKLAEDRQNQNIFVSPLSTAFGLAVTYNGTASGTKHAIARTLEIQGLSLEAVNRANVRLLQGLRSQFKEIKDIMAASKEWKKNLVKGNRTDLRIGLKMASSLWLTQREKFKQEFLKINQEFFGAHLQTLDFIDPQAPDTINSWVAKETSGKITKIVDKIKSPQLLTLILIDTIYFKGPWSTPFNKALTKQRPFTLLNGRKKKVFMMSQSPNYKKKYWYYRGKDFQAVSLPYGDKGRFSMRIFLPDKKSSLKKFLRELNAANWQHWLSGFKLVNGVIMLPRFKVESEVSLKKPLTALGMAVAFDQHKANFSYLCSITPKTNVYIEDIKHKTIVAVDEEGTEASGSLAFLMKRMGVDPPPPRTFKMVIDRPFFVAIDDRETGALLFLGVIVDPIP